MEQNSLKFTCSEHSKDVFMILLQPYQTQSGNPHAENNKSIQYCCDDCLMKIPSSERNGIRCLYLKDINILFRNLMNKSNLNFSLTQNMSRQGRIIEENEVFSHLVHLFKSSIEQELLLSEDSIVLALQDLVKRYQQKLVLEQKEKLTVGDSDFSFESCAYAPEKQYIFVGNRSADLFVIKKDSKEIIKKINCGGRIGAVKYIPGKNTVVVSGLHKYILKINIETLEIMSPSRPSQTTEYKNFIVIEYLKQKELLLLGGFNVEHSIELYNFNNLSLVKTLTFERTPRKLPDELWISLSIESLDTVLLGYKSGNLQVWKSKNFELSHSVRTFEHIYALEYQNDQKLIYTGHLNGVIQIWQMKKGRLSRTKYINIGDFPINKMRFLPLLSSKYLLISNFTNKISVWSHMGHKVDEIEVFQEPSRAILVLSDNTIVSAGATPGIVYFLAPKLVGLDTKTRNHPKKERAMRMSIEDNRIMQNTFQQTYLG